MDQKWNAEFHSDRLLGTLITYLSEYRFYTIFALCTYLLAVVFKHRALEASIRYGGLIRSCFDLFHRDLLKKMAGEAALKDERKAWPRLRRSTLVDRNAWLPEWETDEEQERIENVDKPASRSCLDRALISGLTVVFLVKDVLRESKCASARPRTE